MSTIRALLGRIRASALAKDVGNLWAAQAIVFALAAVQAIVVARLLGPRDFGVAALVMSFTALVFTFLDPRAQEAVVKYLSDYRAAGEGRRAVAVPKVAYGADLIFGVIGLAVVTACAPWAERSVVGREGTAGLLLVFAAASVFTAPVGTSRAVLTSFHRFKSLAVLQIGVAVARVALVVTLVAMGFGVAGVVVGVGSSLVLEAVIAGVLAHRTMVRELGGSWLRGRRRDLGDDFRGLVRFMAYTDATALVASFAKEADVVVLGALAGPTQAGFYRLARSITAPIAGLVQPLQQVVYPRLATLAAKALWPDMGAALRSYFRNIGLPVGALVVVSAAALPLAVPLFAGTEYVGAIVPSIILVIGGGLTLPFFWTRPALLATNSVRLFLGASSVAALVSVVGFVLVAAPFGASGVAVVRAGIAGVLGSGVVALAIVRRLNRAADRAPDPDGRPGRTAEMDRAGSSAPI